MTRYTCTVQQIVSNTSFASAYKAAVTKKEILGFETKKSGFEIFTKKNDKNLQWTILCSLPNSVVYTSVTMSANSRPRPVAQLGVKVKSKLTQEHRLEGTLCGCMSYRYRNALFLWLQQSMFSIHVVYTGLERVFLSFVILCLISMLLVLCIIYICYLLFSGMQLAPPNAALTFVRWPACSPVVWLDVSKHYSIMKKMYAVEWVIRVGLSVFWQLLLVHTPASFLNMFWCILRPVGCLWRSSVTSLRSS